MPGEAIRDPHAVGHDREGAPVPSVHEPTLGGQLEEVSVEGVEHDLGAQGRVDQGRPRGGDSLGAAQVLHDLGAPGSCSPFHRGEGVVPEGGVLDALDEVGDRLGHEALAVPVVGALASSILWRSSGGHGAALAGQVMAKSSCGACVGGHLDPPLGSEIRRSPGK